MLAFLSFRLASLAHIARQTRTCAARAFPASQTSSVRRLATTMSSDRLRQARIIPDLVDGVTEVGTHKLSIAYGGKAVEQGNVLTPKETSHAPDVKIDAGSHSELLTLLMTDPDPPDPANPIRKEWLHWLVMDIPPGGDVSAGHTVTPYMGPAPPIGTHRYAFMLFSQPNQEPLQVRDPSKGEMMGRAHFSTKKFAAAHELGDPIDVKWFNAHK